MGQATLDDVLRRCEQINAKRKAARTRADEEPAAAGEVGLGVQAMQAGANALGSVVKGVAMLAGAGQNDAEDLQPGDPGRRQPGTHREHGLARFHSHNQ